MTELSPGTSPPRSECQSVLYGIHAQVLDHQSSYPATMGVTAPSRDAIKPAAASGVHLHKLGKPGESVFLEVPTGQQFETAKRAAVPIIVTKA
jgi:hypothetical protein